MNTVLPRSVKHFSVLLIEDDEHVAQSTKIVLETIGYTVDWACTTAAAAGKIACNEYHALLLDLRLGHEDGAAMICRLRVALHAIPPVVIVSGAPYERLRTAASLTGAASIVVKPYPIAELTGALQRLKDAASGTVAPLDDAPQVDAHNETPRDSSSAS